MAVDAVDLPRLCAIVDADFSAHAQWDVVSLARSFLDAGVRFLQIRAKAQPSGWLLEASQSIVQAAREVDAIVVVNDRPDVARLSGADGVHVGQDDLAPADARRVLGPAGLIGLSTHTIAQLSAALAEPIDYVAIGPVFETSSKATGYAAVGLELVRQAASVAHARGKPLVAIGGVTLERAADVVRAGVDSVAVISDLLATGDPHARAREYVDRLAGA